MWSHVGLETDKKPKTLQNWFSLRVRCARVQGSQCADSKSYQLAETNCRAAWIRWVVQTVWIRQELCITWFPILRTGSALL